jgi:hypothetical protein
MCSRIGRIALGVVLSSAAGAQDLANAIFLAADGKIDTRRAEVTEKMPLYRKAANPEKYAPWLHNEAAERALRLYRAAYELAHPNGGTPDYYVALVPGGNHAAVGFRLQNGENVEEHPRQAYILLDAEPSRFEGTLLHETGHVAMAMMAGGRMLEGKEMAAIPHTTAALTDRTTAFTEGYAIHLEAIAAHLNRNRYARQRYHRERVLFGDQPFPVSEYFHSSADLATYAQSVARYLDVRDNNFSFDTAFQGADYLRAQLEKARDFATTRDADQLLQSEGFYASFFFLFVVRGATVPPEDTIARRERQVLEAMRAMFAAGGEDVSSPWLIRFVTAYMNEFPDQKSEVVDALNDLSHGAFVDAGAAALWRDHYLAALRLDQEKMNVQGIAQKRQEWRNRALEDPKVLLSRLGPELACTLPGKTVHVEAFGEDAPVRFDLNTAPPAVLRLIPRITEPEIATWLSRRPFNSVADFKRRAGLRPATLSVLRFE